MPLREGTCIQDALQQSGVTKRLSRIKIGVYRRLPQGAGTHKLNVPYDRAKRRVPDEYNYAIHPGDRVVVSKDKTNALDDLLNSALGPIGLNL